MSTTAEAFSSFLTELEPTPHQKEKLIPTRKEAVIKNLKAIFPAESDLPFSHAYLIGSAAKETIIRPVDDIDVLAVFSDRNRVYEKKYRQDSQSFLYRIRKAYDGTTAQQVGARGQAIRVFFQTGGFVDVAPVFYEGGDNYLLPAGDSTWIRTSPLKANRWFAEKDANLNEHLRPLVQLVKKWNREHSSRLSSFHLETVTASTFSSLGSNYRDALAKFFEWVPGHLEVTDPGGHSTDLSAYLTQDQRNRLLESAGSAAERAKKALAAEVNGDHKEAKRLWAIVLGSDFPP